MIIRGEIVIDVNKDDEETKNLMSDEEGEEKVEDSL